MSNSGLPRRKSPKGQCLAAPLPIINHRQHLLKRGKSSARPAAGLSGFGPVQDKGRQPKQPFRDVYKRQVQQGEPKETANRRSFFYAKTHFKAAFCSVTFYTSRQSRPKVSERMAEASRSHSAALFYCRAASQRGYPKGADRDFRSPLLFEQCALRPRRSPDFTQKNRKSSSCYQPCVS